MALFDRSPLWLRRVFFHNLALRDQWIQDQARQIAPGSRVLDVGAGSCPYRQLFAHCEYRSQDFAGLSAEQLRHGGYGAIDYVCDATQIPVADASFDVVLCTEMLEHVMDPAAVIAEIGRVLAPGGLLLLTAPLGSGIHQEPHHYYGGFTPYWYERVLTNAQVEVIDIEPNGGFFRYFAQEALRFMHMTRPFGGVLPPLYGAMFAPIWLLLLPLLGFALPVFGAWADRFDAEKKFTVGYHVRGRKKPRPGEC